MKKLLVALLTFAIGVFAFGLLNLKSSLDFKSANVDLTETLVSTTIPIPDIQSEKPQELKPENPVSFFNSIQENESEQFLLATSDFKGMNEVYSIMLQRDKRNWSASINTQYKDGSSNLKDEFYDVWIKTENNELSFKTNKIRGIEYRFVGEFFKSRKDFVEDEKVLKGTMQKFKKGKKVAEFTDYFLYKEFLCGL